jgi:hypothetical protein
MMPCARCGIPFEGGANKCSLDTRYRVLWTDTFIRGSDGRCATCSKAQGDHYHHSNGIRYCHSGLCCNCMKEDQPGWTYDALACDACKNRQQPQQTPPQPPNQTSSSYRHPQPLPNPYGQQPQSQQEPVEKDVGCCCCCCLFCPPSRFP